MQLEVNKSLDFTSISPFAAAISIEGSIITHRTGCFIKENRLGIVGLRVYFLSRSLSLVIRIPFSCVCAATVDLQNLGSANPKLP